MSDAANTRGLTGIARIIGPGMLVAATGVGAGDLATASFSGSHLGVAVLWAVVVGGLLKFVLTEGLARWQLATGLTLIEGVALRLGRAVGWLFLPYLILFSFFVGGALMSANGATLHAMVPVFASADSADSAETGKLVFGIGASLCGLVLVWKGGFQLFEKVMGVCIAFMFVSVVAMAALLWPGSSAVLSGLFIPSLPAGNADAVAWTVALIGGVGGTVTILCYGYWIREKGREGPDALSICRWDLGAGYAMTIVFGLAMVTVGSTIRIEGQGADLLVLLGDQLDAQLGRAGRLLFLTGAFGAVFSSLLGVWQAIPYLFADLWRLFFARDSTHSLETGHRIDEASYVYRSCLVAISIIPIAGLFMSFQDVQKLYAVVGAAFLPLLALALIILNGRRAWVGKLRNRPVTTAGLVATLVFFGYMAWRAWSGV